MLLSLKFNRFMIFNHEVKFSMEANMHYKRFSTNVCTINDVNVLKSALIFGPNNTGKTNFVRAIDAMKSIMLNKFAGVEPSFYAERRIMEMEIAFLEEGKEYVFEIRYDNEADEYIYERFAEIKRDKYKNRSQHNLLLRDVKNRRFEAVDVDLIPAMRVAARNNILIYLIDADSFPVLGAIRHIMQAFCSRIDIINMNNMPLQKTIDMMKMSAEDSREVASFVVNSDLWMDNFRFADDDEFREAYEVLKKEPGFQENALWKSASFTDLLRLVSEYHGVAVPSMSFDSTGTKKIIAIASYVIDAIKHGRILVVDDLDNSLHFRLTREIIMMFNNELNTDGQLIATVHDISLLDCQTLFRKEQIWFTHKDEERVYLYSLSEFTANENGVRGDSDLLNKYKQGVFGALPEPDLFETLLEVSGK